MSKTGPEVIKQALDEIEAAIAKDRPVEMAKRNEHVVELIALMCVEARKHYKHEDYVIAALQTGAARGLAVQFKLLPSSPLEGSQTAPVTG